MPVYFVTGRLGSGKSLAAVGRIQEFYLFRGRPIALNLDLYLENMTPKAATYTRLPDKPRRIDFDLLGSAYDGDYDESKTGVVVLDECASYLNARTYQDPERAAVLDWFLHARKLGWDLYFLIQDVDSIDKQIRQALMEFKVLCKRLDRVSLIPFVRLPMPRVHVAVVKYVDGNAIADRWWYRGTSLFQAYNTRQSFLSGLELVGDEFIDMRATKTVLSKNYFNAQPGIDWKRFAMQFWYRWIISLAGGCSYVPRIGRV